VSFTYSVFGLSLRSNLPIPELVHADTPSGDAVVSVHMATSPTAREVPD